MLYSFIDAILNFKAFFLLSDGFTLKFSEIQNLIKNFILFVTELTI